MATVGQCPAVGQSKHRFQQCVREEVRAIECWSSPLALGHQGIHHEEIQ
jgi:hypothetical protein